jgi:hypothetical protein
MSITLKTGRKDSDLIYSIAERGVREFQFNYITVALDLTACHCNGTPLNLERLLNADSFNFVHDVVGINRHLDRDTGKLTGFFLPRSSAKQFSKTKARGGEYGCGHILQV